MCKNYATSILFSLYLSYLFSNRLRNGFGKSVLFLFIGFCYFRPCTVLALIIAISLNSPCVHTEANEEFVRAVRFPFQHFVTGNTSDLLETNHGRVFWIDGALSLHGFQSRPVLGARRAETVELVMVFQYSSAFVSRFHGVH